MTDYHVGKVVNAIAARVEAKQTTAPKRYTQDAVMDDMVGAHKFAKDDQERAILKETEGLGTSRTREPALTELINAGYLESRKKGKLYEIRATDLARSTIENLPDVLTEVGTTAKWELAFKMIEKGTATREQVMAALRANLVQIVKIAQSSGKIELSMGKSGAAAPKTPSKFVSQAPPAIAVKSVAAKAPASAKVVVGTTSRKWF